MDEEDNNIEDQFEDLLPLVDRFEQMLEQNEEWFFDVDEFEALSDFYYQNGKLNKALKAAEIGLGQHPNCQNFIIRKAQYFTASDKLNLAQEELAKLESLEPDSFDLYMSKASLQSKKGKHQKAVHYYKLALKKAEFPEDVWPYLALEHQILGNFDLSLKFLKLTLAANPDDEMALYNIALCFDLLEKSEEGIAYFEKFTDKNPYSEVAWYHLSVLLAKEKQYDKSIRAIDYTILIDEYFTAAYYEKARILERTFRYQEAAEAYQASFDFEGPSGYSYYKIGLCYLNMYNTEKALSWLTKAIQDDPDLDEAYYELSLINDEQGMGTEAMYNIEKAIELVPDNINYLFTSAEIHRRAGMLNEAEGIYKTILELGHKDADVFIDYAELLFDLCEFEEGMEILYDGIQENPDSAEMNYRICGYLFALEENDEALVYFKKALQLNPERKSYFFELFPQLKMNEAVKGLLGELEL